MSQSVKEFLQTQIEGKLTEAKLITDDAEKVARPLSEVEKHQLEKLLEDVTNIKTQVKQIEDNEELRDKIDAMRGPKTEPVTEAKAASSIGEAVVDSEQFKTVKAGKFSGKWSTGPIEFKNWYGSKATLMGGQVVDDTGTIITTDVRQGIQALPFERLTVASLFGQGTTNSNAISLPQETVATNAAAAVAEGGAKPPSDFEFVMVTEPVRKIATTLDVSDEILEDVAGLTSYLNGRLGLFVGLAEEQQLLVGNGTAPNLSGLTDRDIQTDDGADLADTAIDALYRAMIAIKAVSFFDADAMVVNTLDWAEIRLQKDGNEQYYGGGPFTGAYGNGGGIAPNNLWGIPVVVTSAVPQGTAIVGAFKAGGTVFRRSGLTIEMTNSHEDNFSHDITTVRAEERLALFIHRPSAFYEVTNLDAVITSA